MRPDPKFAVFFKAYAWDAFVERQAQRCRSSISNGDFFISLDETNGPIQPVPFDRVIRTSTSALVSMGYADRSERGELFWWNADYPHYQIQDLYPDYDYYVFQEYDVTLKGGFHSLICDIAATGADFAALPIREGKQSWCWTDPHQSTYSFEEIEGCLMSLSVFSKRALSMLGRRRLEMSQSAEISFWPSAEVFLPTEIRAAGYVSVSLNQFVDTTRYDWRPPTLEQEVESIAGVALFHPVYDRKRFTAWAIDQAEAIPDFFHRQSPVLQALRRVPLWHRLLPYLTGVLKNLAASFRYRLNPASHLKS